MAARHKRLANEPKTEVAQIAEERLRQPKESRANCGGKEASKGIERRKGQGTKRRRAREDDQSGYRKYSASTSGFSSADMMPATMFPFVQGQAESMQAMQVGEPTTQKRNLPDGKVNSSQMKRGKLDKGPVLMTRSSSGLNRVYKDDFRSSLMHRLSEARFGPTYQDLPAFASVAAPKYCFEKLPSWIEQ